MFCNTAYLLMSVPFLYWVFASLIKQGNVIKCTTLFFHFKPLITIHLFHFLNYKSNLLVGFFHRLEISELT